MQFSPLESHNVPERSFHGFRRFAPEPKIPSLKEFSLLALWCMDRKSESSFG
jgi:hypothetical protein